VKDQQWTVVISQKFAQRYFPNENPIGRQITLRGAGDSETEQHPRQIVGIVGDIANYGVQQQAFPFIYLSYLQQPDLFWGGSIEQQLHQTLLLRPAPGFAGGNAQLVAAVKKAVTTLDADQPVTDVMTMKDALADSISDSRFYMRIMGLFAAIAVLLAAIGIYGVISYFVTQRTHEIGIRMALGAQPGRIIGMVSGLGLKLAAFGVVIGAGMAFGLTRLISRFLYGVKATDPVTYGLVAICLVGIAWLACYLPARRAARSADRVTPYSGGSDEGLPQLVQIAEALTERIHRKEARLYSSSLLECPAHRSLAPVNLSSSQVNVLCLARREAVTNIVRHAHPTVRHVALWARRLALDFKLCWFLHSSDCAPCWNDQTCRAPGSISGVLIPANSSACSTEEFHAKTR
jgi:hypothetical protein